VLFIYNLHISGEVLDKDQYGADQDQEDADGEEEEEEDFGFNF
jgi:hypothetical protein